MLAKDCGLRLDLGVEEVIPVDEDAIPSTSDHPMVVAMKDIPATNR